MWSVITCSADDTRFAAVEANLKKVLAAEEFEIIRIPDARSMAEGYTRGVAQSKGETIILCHDDIEVLEQELPRKLRRALEHADIIGVAGTAKLCGAKWVSAGPPNLYGQIIQLCKDPPGFFDVISWSAPMRIVVGLCALDGVFLCTTRRVLDAVPFDPATFDGFHVYDVDFTFSAFRKGFGLAVCTDLPILHRSYGEFDETFNRYAARFREKYRGQLSPMPEIDWSTCLCRTKHIERALEFFHPPHFGAGG